MSQDDYFEATINFRVKMKARSLQELQSRIDHLSTLLTEYNVRHEIQWEKRA